MDVAWGEVGAARLSRVNVGECLEALASWWGRRCPSEQCFTSRVSLGLKEGGKRKKPKQRDESKKKKSTKGKH